MGYSYLDVCRKKGAAEAVLPKLLSVTETDITSQKNSIREAFDLFCAYGCITPAFYYLTPRFQTLLHLCPWGKRNVEQFNTSGTTGGCSFLNDGPPLPV